MTIGLCWPPRDWRRRHALTRTLMAVHGNAMSVIRFKRDDLALFAAASRDHNPLHQSVVYARRTAFGEPVVFGMLAVLAAISRSRFLAGHLLANLAFNFRKPMFCDVDYELNLSESKPGQVKVSLQDAGQLVLTGRFGYQPGEAAQNATWFSPDDPHLAPARRLASDLTTAMTVSGRYGPVREEFAELLNRWQLADKGMTPAQIAVLLWCSYLIGMHLPGEGALFSHVQVRFEPGNDCDDLPLSYRAQVSEFDPRFNVVHIDAVLERGPLVCARANLSSFLRFEAPRLALDLLAQQLPSCSALTGKTALVIGGSRGLGAAIVAALVSQGCHVLLSYQFSSEQANALQQQLRASSGQITMVQGDASNAAWCRQLRREMTERGETLDILVCNASPAIRELGFALESVDRLRAFVDRSMALISIPIAGFRDWLEARGGKAVLISSAIAAPEALDDPANWRRGLAAEFPQYVAAKYATEGLLKALAAQITRTQFLIVRPPRLLTDQTNTVTGRQGAIGVEGVAAKIVKRLCEPDSAGILDFTDSDVETSPSVLS